MNDKKTITITIEEYNSLLEKQKQVDELKGDYVKGYEAGVDEGWDNAVKDTAIECLEQFICRLVNARLVGVNDDLYYELLETKDDLLKEKYGVEVE